MSNDGSSSLSVLGRELGQYLLICGLGFLSLRLMQNFWDDPLTMIAGSSVLVAGMLLVKRDLAITVTGIAVGILGPLGDMAAVRVGAWSYTTPHVEGVPAWLFLQWGAVGIFVAATYEFLRVLILQTDGHGSDSGS
ncbi:MAG: hypothetical protein AAGF71_04755 [Pseudomonadota bacterium]